MLNTNPAMRLVHSKAKEGCAQAYEALILGMFESMKRFPGFLGAELLPPTELNDKYQVVTKLDRKSTRLNSSHIPLSRMPSSA